MQLDSTVLHSRTVIERSGEWPDYRKTQIPGDQLFWVNAARAGLRFVGVPRVTVWKFNASSRPGCYIDRRCEEQAHYLQLLEEDPNLAEPGKRVVLTGINAKTKEAVAQHAYKQTGLRKGFVIWKPPNGFVQDIVETAADNFSHTPTPVARSVADIMARANRNITIIAHSQGGAIANAAIEYLAHQGVNVSALTVNYLGGAVNSTLTRIQMGRVGVSVNFYNNPFDLVPNIVGGNAISGFCPWRLVTSILGIPTLFTPKSVQTIRLEHRS